MKSWRGGKQSHASATMILAAMPVTTRLSRWSGEGIRTCQEGAGSGRADIRSRLPHPRRPPHRPAPADRSGPRRGGRAGWQHQPDAVVADLHHGIPLHAFQSHLHVRRGGACLAMLLRHSWATRKTSRSPAASSSRGPRRKLEHHGRSPDRGVDTRSVRAASNPAVARLGDRYHQQGAQPADTGAGPCRQLSGPHPRVRADPATLPVPLLRRRQRRSRQGPEPPRREGLRLSGGARRWRRRRHAAAESRAGPAIASAG